MPTSDHDRRRRNRRHFLKQSAQGSAWLASAITAPAVLPSSALGLDDVVAPSDRIRVGLIGCGHHGAGWNLQQIFRCPDVQVASVCDVDTGRLNRSRKIVDDHYRSLVGKSYRSCAAHRDFRKLILRDDLDAVAVCTPDHWHVIPAIMAARCGKDVICEKPLTLFIDEGKQLRRAVRENNRVFQTASENRSLDVYLRLVELIRGGVIGRLKHIEVRLPAGNTSMRVVGTDRETFSERDVRDPPTTLDYDMWLGQTAKVPYIPARVHGNFRWNLAYSGGVLTDWGAHMCDLAQWGHQTERTGPVEVEGRGDLPPRTAVHNTAPSFEIQYVYADGVTMTVSSGPGDLDPDRRHVGPVVGRTPQPGIRFEGTDGWIESHKWRGSLKASERAMLDAQVDPAAVDIYRPSEIVPRKEKRGGEHRNFYDCVKSRRDCYAPAETGHRTATIPHLGNISMLLRRKLRWDPLQERFPDDAEANAMISRQQREPWTMANIDSWI